MAREKASFIVTIEYDDVLTPTLVRNYINAALLKFDRYYKKDPSSGGGYFDGTTPPKIYISKVPYAKWDDLREIVAQVQAAQNHVQNARDVEAVDR